MSKIGFGTLKSSYYRCYGKYFRPCSKPKHAKIIAFLTFNLHVCCWDQDLFAGNITISICIISAIPSFVNYHVLWQSIPPNMKHPRKVKTRIRDHRTGWIGVFFCGIGWKMMEDVVNCLEQVPDLRVNPCIHGLELYIVINYHVAGKLNVSFQWIYTIYIIYSYI
jgi:hypothetical protein